MDIGAALAGGDGLAVLRDVEGVPLRNPVGDVGGLVLGHHRDDVGGGVGADALLDVSALVQEVDPAVGAVRDGEPVVRDDLPFVEPARGELKAGGPGILVARRRSAGDIAADNAAGTVGGGVGDGAVDIAPDDHALGRLRVLA